MGPAISIVTEPRPRYRIPSAEESRALNLRSRILFISYSAQWTGPTNSLVQLLKHLKHRHDIAVLLPGEGPLCAKLETEGIRYHSFATLSKWRLPAMTSLIRREKIDLVYANNTHGSSRLAFVAASAAGVPFICHVRGIAWHRSWASLGYLWLADSVNAVSHACAVSVERFVRPGRLQVIHNGVPLEMMERRGSEGSSLRSEVKLPSDAFIVLSVSHVCERKGQEHAIAAMPWIVQEVPTAHLCLVGSLERDEEYVNKLRGLVQRYGLEGRVHFLGFKSDVEGLLCDADLFVHSAIADPHPRSVIEAMAVGLPVVAFAVDGVAETVVDSETGHLIKAGDPDALARAIVGLACDPSVRNRQGQAGRYRVKTHFTDVLTAEKIDAVICSVLDRREARGSLRAWIRDPRRALGRLLPRSWMERGNV